MIKLVIIDDEPDARFTLKTMLQKYCPDINVAGEAEDVISGVSLIRLTKPDIVLLDIHLGKEMSFDILDKFSNPSFRVIFVTAFDIYALKAFRYFALDYLLKPVDPDLLLKGIDKAKEDIAKNRLYHEQYNGLLESHRTKTFNKIALPSSEGVTFIALENILYLQSDANYCSFFTQNGEKMMVSKPLKNFEEILPKKTFCRVHHSYILNIRHVKKYLKEDGGYALLENGKKIPISRRRKEYFMNLLV